MITQLKLKNQNFILPKEWKGRDVFVRRSNDVIIIKKIEKKSFWKTWDIVKACSKDIRAKDIKDAINYARKNK